MWPLDTTDARYRTGTCEVCGDRLRIHRRAGHTQCRCGALYANLTCRLATDVLLADMSHPRGGVPLLVLA